jgi:galactokinase
MKPMNQITFESETRALVVSAIENFKKHFQQEPEWIGLAPGRVNMIGGHTDYNQGFVMPFAVERYTVVVGGRSAEPSQTTAISGSQSDRVSVDLNSDLTPGMPKWGNYLKGVAHGLKEKGWNLPNVNLFIDSNLPDGAGLSSSAALEVSIASMFEKVAGQELDPLDKALLCQKAEHDFANVPCGAMDQIISVFGQPKHMLRLDCVDFSMQQVPFDANKVAVLITNSNVKHELGDSQYSVRRSQCESAAKKMGVESLRHATLELLAQHKESLTDKEFDRAHHIITENARTLKFLDSMRANDFATAGQLLYETHASLRDDFEVSCEELDVLVEIAKGIGLEGGVFGSRMTGGGFGGCTVSLVAVDAVDRVTKKLEAAYADSAEGRQATVLKTKPAQGGMSFTAEELNGLLSK